MNRVHRLHLTAAVAVPGCLAAGAFELSRALGGNELSWLYAAEWPMYAGLGLYVWRRLVRESQAAGRPAVEGASSTAPTPSAGPPAADPAAAGDPGLAAWQDYLRRLHQAQPPGGPPRARR